MTTPLHAAVTKGQIKIVERLLDRKAEIDARDINQRTPLIDAIEGNTKKYDQPARKLGCRMKRKIRQAHAKTRISIIELLVKRGADVNARDINQITPLDFAIVNDEIKIIELLLDNDANPNAKDRSNRTVLCRLSSDDRYTGSDNSIPVVGSLLRHGADPNICDDEGITPLHATVRGNNLRFVKMLIDNHADINARDLKNQTPLHHSILEMNEGSETKRQIAMAHLLLELGANPNLYDTDGYTPMHLLMASKPSDKFLQNLAEHCQLVDHFLSSGADPNGVSVINGMRGPTPLQHATSEKCSAEFIEYFLNKGAEVNVGKDYESSPLYQATQNGDEATVKVLLNHGARFEREDSNDESILQYAVDSRCSGTVKQILKFCYANSESISYSVTMSLYSPSARRFFDRLGLWLKKRAANNDGITKNQYRTTLNKLLHDSFTYESNFDSDDDQDYFKRIELEETKIVKLLLSNRINLDFKDYENRTMISYAIKYNDVEMTKFCLTGDNGEYTDSAFNVAVGMGRRNIVDIFMQHDPDIGHRLTADGTTALLWTAMGKHDCPFIDEEDISIDDDAKDDIARLLVSKGVNMNCCWRSESTLTIAARNNRVNLVEFLIKNISLLNHENERYDVKAIHAATEYDRLNIVKLLLRYGMDVDKTNASGRTALDIACERRHVQIVKFLLNYGACLSYHCYQKFVLSTSNSSEISGLIERHLLWMIGSGRGNLQKIDSVCLKELSVDFVERCKEEGAKMRNENIGDSNVCFYDVFEKEIDQLTMYVRNESIRQDWESRDLAQEFPIHYNVMNNNFWKGQTRLSLLDSGAQVFRSIHGCESMPELVMDHLFSYLDDKDLKNFAEAGANNA